ncbi:unnamed protein product [Nyctereutes procyonoides]|uniref:(raccoon dog) hypothetical protein n=1 Tax=Nyctereutes procyonoides TaxID=34880 RepID=A0A811Y6L2_NYCPR|nr:unnamed protein product [Nyctereutes procyonoides]
MIKSIELCISIMKPQKEKLRKQFHSQNFFLPWSSDARETKAKINYWDHIKISYVHGLAEMRNSILAQVLDQSAQGPFNGEVSEQGLIEILEKVSQQTEKKTTVKFNRRKVMDSDDEDDY